MNTSSEKAANLLENIPEEEWVILSTDQARVVAHDADLPNAIAAARNLGEDHGVIMKAEALGRVLIGCHR